MLDLDKRSIMYLPGVGPKKAEILQKEAGISSYEDMLFYFPYKYIDRSRFYKVAEVTGDMPYIQMKGRILFFDTVGEGRTRRLIGKFTDGTGTIDLVWFKGINYVLDKIKTGVDYIVFGKPTEFGHIYNIPHPDIDPLDQADKVANGLTPFYNTSEKMKKSFLNSRAIQNLQYTLLSGLNWTLPETLPPDVLNRIRMMSFPEAIRNVHFPESVDKLRKAQLRLKFDELFFIQLNILRTSNLRKLKLRGIVFPSVGDYFNTFYKEYLPFELTNAQKRVVREIRADMGSGRQMNRLLQGDVGSGKTLVALLSMLLAVDNHCQACMMAPTEILATQHYATVMGFLKDMDIKVALLTGSTKKKERNKMTDLRKTAVYIRLSAEDDNVDGRAKKESDSVTSQRILLKSFAIDELGVAESDILEYVDDGVSGTHFKRQGFQQLQDDMKSGEIGCVVVKDFSRFGRDYLEVGFYIEYIFPLLQIRFISINDSYDSAASSGMTGGMNVALQNLVYNMYSLDLSKKISSALQTRTRNGTRLPVNARYGYKKGKDGRLEVDPEAAKVVKMIFKMAAKGTSFADITRELNRQAIATCDEQKLSRGDQVQFQRFDTIKKKHWSPTTVAAIVRDEIYIGTRIWGKTRCSMHTGHKAVLNDETEWVRLENHHTAIIDRALFEKANEMHPKKKRSVAESRTNFTLERRKKQPALLICANCGHSLLKETEHLLKCSDARTNGDPVCRSLVIRREPLEENILGLVHQYAASMLEKEKKVSSNRQCDYKEINTAELQKQSRQLTSEKMKLYDDYKDGRIDRDSYKQRAATISVQLDEIKRKIEDAENSKKLLEQNELSDKIKLKDFLGIQKFDTEKLREIIKVIRVHSQDEIEIEWNFDDIFSEQR